MAENWSEKSLAELREEAKTRGLKGVSAMRKNELAELLRAEDQKKEDQKKEEQRREEPKRDEEREKKRQSVVQRPRATNEVRSVRTQHFQADESTARRYAQDNRENQGRRQDSGDYRDNRSRRQDNDENRDNRSRRQDNGESRENRDNRDNRGRRQDNGDYRDNRGRRQDSVDNRDSRDNRGRRQDYSENRNRRPDNTELPSQNPEPVQEPASRDYVYMDGWNTGTRYDGMGIDDMKSLDSGVSARGILEVMPEGYGFIRSENYLPGEDDVYVSPSQIRRFNMKTGDIVSGSIRVKTGTEKFAALLYISQINGEHPSVAENRRNFEDLTPVFPNSRLRLEREGGSLTMRILDLMSPIGKGQRGMIVSPPKAGKTTLMKEIAASVQKNHPEVHIIILLIDERPEEVTDIKECICGENVEVIYSTFDELPEHHRRVSEMVLGRAKRLVEHGRDVIILLDSITRLARAYNLSVTPSGRTLSGGLDPAALHMPKKFFGAARNMREGGSLTILATALVDTGSRMDDVVFEEFKGTGNMEVVLDRKLSERRIFPAIDMQKSGTRREDLLLTQDERDAVNVIRRGMNGMRSEDAVEEVIRLFTRTRNNREFVESAKKIHL